MKASDLIPFLFFLLAACNNLTAQDTIVFENQYPFLVNVLQESDQAVRYTRFGEEKSPVFLLKKRFVTDIKYQFPDSAYLLYRPDTVFFTRDLDVWVTLNADASVTRGLLHRMDDTTLYLRKKAFLFSGGKKYAQEIESFTYDQIFRLQVRKQRRIRDYAIVGTTVGFVVGTLAGLAIFDDSPPCDPLVSGVDCDNSLSSPRTQWDKAFLFGLGAAGGGFVTGGAIGAIKLKIPIGGKKDQFNAAIPQLERMARYLEESN